MEALKDAGRFCLGVVFIISCIPPALIIFAIAVSASTMDIENP